MNRTLKSTSFSQAQTTESFDKYYDSVNVIEDELYVITIPEGN